MTIEPVDKKELFKRIWARIHERRPDLKLETKRQWWLHRVINFILNLVYPADQKDAYLNRFSTSFWGRISLACDAIDNCDMVDDLCHEFQHMEQERKATKLGFALWYLWPLSPGIVVLLTCWLPFLWSSGWVAWVTFAAWLTFGGLHFIPQIPDPGRRKYEYEAYTVTLHILHFVRGELTRDVIDWAVKQFHSMAYFIMVPDENEIRGELIKTAALIETHNSPVRRLWIVQVFEEEYLKLREEIYGIAG